MRIHILFTPLTGESNLFESHTAPLKMEGTTCNISAGGALVETPYRFEESTYMLAHLILENSRVPHLILCKSTWSEPKQGVSGQSQCGIKFITSERMPLSSHLEKLGLLPPEVLEFDREKQLQLDSYLQSIN